MEKWVASLNFLALSAKRRTSAETLTEMPGNKTGAVAAARAEGEASTIGYWNWTSKKEVHEATRPASLEDEFCH